MSKIHDSSAHNKQGLGVSLPFNSRGILKSGIYPLTWKAFCRLFVYNQKREELLRGLLRAISCLRQAGCRTIYIGGSFVSTKQNPSDIDVVWDSTKTNWQYLKKIAPVFFEMTSGSPKQKRLYKGEFYPSEGIESISGMSFFDFFQRDRQPGRRRGLVQLDITRI